MCLRERNTNWRKKSCQIQYVVAGRWLVCTWRTARLAGVGFLGRGQPAPSHQLLGCLGERCELPSGVRGRAPAAKRFYHIWSTQDPSPDVIHALWVGLCLLSLGGTRAHFAPSKYATEAASGAYLEGTYSLCDRNIFSRLLSRQILLTVKTDFFRQI